MRRYGRVLLSLPLVALSLLGMLSSMGRLTMAFSSTIGRRSGQMGIRSISISSNRSSGSSGASSMREAYRPAGWVRGAWVTAMRRRLQAAEEAESRNEAEGPAENKDLETKAEQKRSKAFQMKREHYYLKKMKERRTNIALALQAAEKEGIGLSHLLLAQAAKIASGKGQYRLVDKVLREMEARGFEVDERSRIAAIRPKGTFAFDLPFSRLVVVDGAKSLAHADRIVKQAVLLGLDTETRPVFVKDAPPEPTALLQIATRCPKGEEHVLLFDLLTLLPKHCQALDAALCPVFSDPSCIKVGQGLAPDVRALRRSYPMCASFAQIKSVCELHGLHAKLSLMLWQDEQLVLQQQQHPQQQEGGQGQEQLKQKISRLGHQKKVHALSLKLLTMRYLQMKLNKKAQRSNWARRPLSKRQLDYAASDALICLRIYDSSRSEILSHEPSYSGEGLLTDLLMTGGEGEGGMETKKMRKKDYEEEGGGEGEA